MVNLDDMDIGTLLRLEADLSDQTLDEFLEFIRRHYGLAHVSYQCPTFPGCSLASPFILPTVGGAWFEYYKEFIDPLFNIGARSVLPVDWARLPKRKRNVLPIFGAKEAYPERQGLTIPVRGPTNDVWALFSVTSNESDIDWARRRYQLVKDLVRLANYVHQRACQLHAEKNSSDDFDVITDQEVEALELCSEEKNLSEMAILMRVSAETVKARIDTARFKLRALNRVHAVSKALQAGLIR